MEKFLLKQASSLEKIFLSDNTEDKKEFNSFSALLGEVFSYQIMYKSNNCDRHYGEFSFESPLKNTLGYIVFTTFPVVTWLITS